MVAQAIAEGQGGSQVAFEQVVEAIKRERTHQERKWGCHPRPVAGWLLILERELQEAKEAWATSRGDGHALEEILQVASVAMACLEEHGIVEREE